MWQKLIEKYVRFFVIKCDIFITKRNSYYKLWRFYYKMRQLFQMQRLLQITTVQTSVMTADKYLDI